MFPEIFLTQFERAIYKTRNTGTGDGMRETRGMRQILYSAECPQKFRAMLLNILWNVAKHSGECPQTFGGMSPMFGVNEENYLAESHLESFQTSTMELLCENSQQS